MNSTQNGKIVDLQDDILLHFYTSSKTVLSVAQLRLLYPHLSSVALNLRMHRYVKSGKILNPRKGFYAKSNYNVAELACMLYTPSYLSLDYVLRKAGVIFQYGEDITMISYHSRTIELPEGTINYRGIKGEIMVDTRGIVQEGNINIATPERAFLDTLYLNPNYYFDNLNSLNRDLIAELLPIYNCKRLNTRVNKLLSHGSK